jgi:hypothetical protein
MPSLWLVPAAFAAHVAEEAPGFTRWARRNTSRHPFHVREGLMTWRGAAAGTALASVFHALIVADQVYFVDWRALRR